MGQAFRQTVIAESLPRFERSFWGTVSVRRLNRKVRPVIWLESGSQFPKGLCLGNRDPL